MEERKMPALYQKRDGKWYSVLAHHLDLPPGQMAVAMLCGVAALGEVWKRARRRG